MEKGNKVRIAIIIVACIVILAAILAGVYYLTRQLDTLETTDTRVYQNKTVNETDTNATNKATNELNQVDGGEE